MIKHMYVIRNVKSGLYDAPHVIPEDIDRVINSWEVSANSGMINTYQANIELYYIGTFDDINGHIELKEHPEFVLDGRGYFAKSQESKKIMDAIDNKESEVIGHE